MIGDFFYWTSKFETQLYHEWARENIFYNACFENKTKDINTAFVRNKILWFHLFCKYVTILAGLHSDVFLLQSQLFFIRAAQPRGLKLDSHFPVTQSLSVGPPRISHLQPSSPPSDGHSSLYPHCTSKTAAKHRKDENFGQNPTGDK